MQKLEENIVKIFLPFEAREQFMQGDIARRFLDKSADIIKLLSDHYVNNEKTEILKKMAFREVVEAYALYYLPINFFKLRFLLSQIDLADNLNVLDFGAGPATASLALLREDKKVNLSIYDKSLEMLAVAEKLLKAERQVYRVYHDSRQALDKKYDLIMVANALNEFSSEEEDIFIKNIDKSLSENGILLLLEPALKVTSRRLMNFRNKFLSFYKYQILYPCTHCQACQMLKSLDDWCHASLEGLNSRLVKQIDEITGYNKHRLKYAALIFKKTSPLGKSHDYRIVTLPNKDRRGVEMTLCGTDFYGKKLFKKDAEDLNGKKIKRCDFFDVVSLDEP